MEAIKLNLTVRREAYCPACCIRLQHFSFKFPCGAAFCASCVRLCQHITIIEAADALRKLHDPCGRIETYGLLWWTPRQPPTEGLHYARMKFPDQFTCDQDHGATYAAF